MMSSLRKRVIGVAAVVALAAGTVAGCGGGDDGAGTGGQGGGITTEASAAGAQLVATVPVADGSQAVVAGYTPEIGSGDTPGGTRVQATIGDVVALMLPPALGDAKWTAGGGTADGTIAELVGSGTAKVTPRNGGVDPGWYAFTYRATSAGTGTLEFREEKPAAGGGASKQTVAYSYTLVVSE